MKEGTPIRSPGIIEHVTRAPLVFLILFFFGGFLHYLYPLSVFSGNLSVAFGVLFLALAPLLMFWSQLSIRRFRRKEGEISAEHFKMGPYRFTRNPTYLGLTFLIIGFGLLANSLLIALSAIVSFMLVHFTILRKEERLLEDKYGEHYRAYKEKVRRWL